ncbi:Dabb family protein [Endozoicomonas elysicola]|uniref:Stress-response A/B barrel domain-containing protein n=1 Tax=Endozoicomonas elysicola TaxID=305900 RepID=A0A081K8A3_9GAMM|nr:Dabb family protein [Endozoicomonas elysicola]KEI70379.1 hypothetical protein GV64_06230 [Endozoicomonas elysicola]
MKHLFNSILLISLVLLGGCASTAETSPPNGIKHIVLVWLENTGNQQDRAEIIKHSEDLRSIPGLLDLQVGLSVPSDRKIVDDSFDVGLVMTFSDQESMDAYIKHPLHQQKVKTHFAPLSRKILIYDIRY